MREINRNFKTIKVKLDADPIFHEVDDVRKRLAGLKSQ
jgi:hypothetical protein